VSLIGIFPWFAQKLRRWHDQVWFGVEQGRKVEQKRALRPQDVWMIRGRLRTEGRKRDLALFNLAIDSKPSACDLSPCKSKMSATIACIGVLRTPKELRSGVAKRPKAGAQPGHGGFTANSQQADLGHRLSTPGSVSSDSEPIRLF
jgi:hypothetical protein